MKVKQLHGSAFRSLFDTSISVSSYTACLCYRGMLACRDIKCTILKERTSQKTGSLHPTSFTWWVLWLQLFLGSQVFFIRMKNWWCQRCPHTIASSTKGTPVRVGDMSPESVWVFVSERAKKSCYQSEVFVCVSTYRADAVDRLLILQRVSASQALSLNTM